MNVGGFGLVKPGTDAIKPTFVALARLLFATGPEWAERGWRVCEEIDGRPGQWFVLQEQNHKAYIVAGESGRFSVGKPEGVDEAALPVIDQTGPAPTLLRSYMEWLAGEAAAADPTWEANVQRIVQAVQSADSPGWMRSELSDLMMGFVMKEPGISDYTFATELEVKTRDRYFAFQMPGMLVATVCLLTRVAYVAAPVDMVFKAFAVPGSLNLFATPQVFLRDMLAKISKVEGGVEKIAIACASLQADAEGLADVAEAAEDFGTFDGSIYASVPLAYAGQQGFEFLADHGFGKPGEYKMLANVCEERMASALATLGTGFRNAMDWRAIVQHRAAIAEARKRDGDGAAEMLADQYTRLMLLYPRFVRGFLLGETDVMPFKG